MMTLTEWVLALIIAVILAVLGVYGVQSARTKSACLEMGYAESDVDWTLTAYCVQRDYRGVMKAIPLEELR